jgi:hypothetical protein
VTTQMSDIDPSLMAPPPPPGATTKASARANDGPASSAEVLLKSMEVRGAHITRMLLLWLL